jgi:hypothetical protein
MSKLLFALGFMALMSAQYVAAQTCDLPVPFTHEFQNNVSASLNASGTCALTVSTTSASRTTAAAFLHYRRPTPLASVRYGFRLDTSAVSTMTTVQSVQVFAAPSNGIIGTTAPQSNALYVVFHGDGPYGALQFVAADADSLPPPSSRATLTGSLNTIRVEINVGAPGSVKYWINHQFTDTPDGTVEGSVGSGLDNSGLTGVSGAEIGLSNPNSPFRSAHVGEAIIFDQFESNDDLLFYDDFSSGAQ